jgi:hypothetical protein
MPKASTYNIYTLNASTPPYGLWINIPFRTKGSTAIRDEAKTRGARFVPAAKGKMKWWLPQNKFTTETIAWLNTNQMIHGERLAPVFNANALQFSDINTALPFRLWLVVPFAHKDGVKNLGAKWSGDLKKWYFDNRTLTPGIFTNMLANKWAWCFSGTTVSNPGQISEINFSAEDLGEAYPSLNLRKPTAAPAADAGGVTSGVSPPEHWSNKGGDVSLIISDNRDDPGHSLTLVASYATWRDAVCEALL